jgi:hypothetical protein
MQAWLSTIVRNRFHSEYRKRHLEDADGKYAATLTVHSAQNAHLDFDDLQKALIRIPLTGTRHFCWSERRAFPTSRRPGSAAAPSAPSFAGSTAPAIASPN